MNDPVITIDKLAYGGAGFGLRDGKACFVPFTAPGDQLRMEVVRDKRSYCEGVLKEVLRPASCRTEPLCPVFGRCGGCFWQHVDYAEQCAQKNQIFVEALWRGARVERHLIEPLIFAPQPYHYRSRVQLKIHNASGCFHAGFYRQGTHYVIDLPGKCVIAAPELNAAYSEFARVMVNCPESEKIPQIDLAVGDNGNVLAVVHFVGAHPAVVIEWLQKQQEKFTTVTGLHLQNGRKSTLMPVFGLDRLTYHIPDGRGMELELSFQAGGFAQVNYQQNRALVETTLLWSGLTGSERILDLFCGNGNLSLPLAGQAGQVLGLESFQPSIEEARRNSQNNNITNAVFRCDDTFRGVKELVNAGEKFNIVILDPPRTGALEAVESIAALSPDRIIYISCDPATLARDLNKLCNHGYQVQKSRPLDMFPQTYHIESITLLDKIAQQQ